MDPTTLYAAMPHATAAIGIAAITQATALIRQCEGCRLSPYQDSKGRWTIGIGCLTDPHGRPVTAHTAPITFEQAEALMNGVLEQIAPKLAAMVRVFMHPHEGAALLSFQYNEGSGALADSTLLRDFNAGNLPGAGDQFAEWIYVREDGKMVRVPGLVNRRALERAVFLGLVSPTPTVPAVAGTTADDLNANELNGLGV